MTAPEPTPTADEHTDAVARACLLALHDQTCPEGGDCRARWPHAAASGWFDGPRFIRDVSNAAAIHEALAANLPADVMLAALVDRGNDAELARRLEWATGLNGATLLVAIRSEGLEVVRVTPEHPPAGRGCPVSAPKVGDRVRVIAGQWTGWEGVVTADLISGYGLVVQLASPAHPGRIYTSTLRRDEVEVIEP